MGPIPIHPTMKASRNKYFKTVIQIEILSADKPVDSTNLFEINNMITFGDCSGNVEIVKTRKLSANQMKEACSKQGSDPSFFDIED